MTHYIFDVDGTLTPSRQRIDKDFENWLEQWGTRSAYYIVTGSDRAKTLEQIGGLVYQQAISAYQCSGNDHWQQDRNIRTNTITLPPGLLAEFDKILYKSKFYVKTGQHVDYRPGLVNFSIVGRGCTFEQRVMYRQWDEHKDERGKISRKLSKMFPDFSFQVAGETGIDITKVGLDKSQILVDFDKDDHIYFFGDMVDEGGNDYELAQALNQYPNAKVFKVKDWQDTWTILKRL